MCNRYVPPDVADLERLWHIGRQNPNKWWRDLPTATKPWKPGLGPLGDGPFFRAGGELVIGQWGVIPDGSPVRIPIDQRTGKRLSTNNTRREKLRIRSSMWHPIWQRGQRCLIPATSYDEPYWGHEGKNIWWRFKRKDGQPWALAGVWNDWTDPETGEVISSYSMLTMNCDSHPLLNLMHRPDVDRKTGAVLPPEKQDKRTVISIENADWDTWLHGSVEEAEALLRMPPLELFDHGAANPAQQVALPV